jgi:hypothetical protein
MDLPGEEDVKIGILTRVDIVLRCITSVRFSVKLNRGLLETFLRARCLRQGDLISP